MPEKRTGLYLAWYDGSRDKNLEAKVFEAAIRFRRKFGLSATEVRVAPPVKGEHPETLAGLRVVTTQAARSCTCLVGSPEAPEDFV